METHDVIVAGGGFVGCEVTIFLAEAGKRIRIIELLDEVASGMHEGEKQVRGFQAGPLVEPRRIDPWSER